MILLLLSVKKLLQMHTIIWVLRIVLKLSVIREYKLSNLNGFQRKLFFLMAHCFQQNRYIFFKSIFAFSQKIRTLSKTFFSFLCKTSPIIAIKSMKSINKLSIFSWIVFRAWNLSEPSKNPAIQPHFNQIVGKMFLLDANNTPKTKVFLQILSKKFGTAFMNMLLSSKNNAYILSRFSVSIRK